jgi:hypothetical protein
MSHTTHHTVRPDAKGRVPLGALSKGVSSFSVHEEDGRIILEPNAEIPKRELWLFNNKEALKSLKSGLKDAAEEKVSKRRESFSKYLDSEID